MNSSSSCSTPGEISYKWEQLELYDESSILDGEVGKRLNQMVSIPVSIHVFLFGITPLINELNIVFL